MYDTYLADFVQCSVLVKLRYSVIYEYIEMLVLHYEISLMALTICNNFPLFEISLYLVFLSFEILFLCPTCSVTSTNKVNLSKAFLYCVTQ